MCKPQTYSFPSPRVSLGGTRSFLSKDLPEHCTANHGDWIKCIFEQLDRISNVVACLPQKNLPVAERIVYTNNRAGFFCDGSRNFCLLRWRPTRTKNCACTRQRATRNKSQYTVKNTTTCSNFFCIIRARPTALTP
jgi:hypothetical protein